MNALLLQTDTIKPVSLTSWQLDVPVILGIIGSVAIYLWVTSEGERERYPGGEAVPPIRVAAFFGGLLAFGIALLSPLEPLSDDYLFSAHMVQHILITIVGPPLMLLGIPPWLYAAAARGLGPVWQAWRFLTKPLLAFLIFNITFSVVHFPLFYNWALRDENVHILEHVLLWSTAFIGWWPVLAPSKELGALNRPMKGIYLLGCTLPSQLVGALVTFANSIIYDEYLRAEHRVWGLSPLADQQIGGLIMWVLVGAFFLFAAMIILGRWAAEQAAHEGPPSRSVRQRQRAAR